MTSVGTMRGERKTILRRLRPGKRPRTHARAAGTPTRVAKTVVPSATIKLTRSASRNDGDMRSYQWSVKPEGGNTSTGEDAKEPQTVMTIGSSRKQNTNPTTVPNARRAISGT